MVKQVTQPTKTNSPSSVFLGMGLDMTWRLALVVLIPVIGGAELDKALKTSPLFVLIGLGLAVVGTIFVLWKTLQEANKLPVPKLSDAEKRKIQKQYEEDDD